MYTWTDGTELYHHGILGQKWGVRNGPPYPLDAKRHSANENKAGWRKSLISDSDAGSSKKFKLDDKTKKILKIGAITATTALVAYGGYKLYQNGSFDHMKDIGSQYAKKNLATPKIKVAKSDFISIDAYRNSKNGVERLAANYDFVPSTTEEIKSWVTDPDIQDDDKVLAFAIGEETFKKDWVHLKSKEKKSSIKNTEFVERLRKYVYHPTEAAKNVDPETKSKILKWCMVEASSSQQKNDILIYRVLEGNIYTILNYFDNNSRYEIIDCRPYKKRR